MQADNPPQYFGKDLEAMAAARNYHQWILSEFAPYLGDSVAEVGAGTGDFSKLVLGRNIRSLKAFEPSQNMYPLLRDALSKDPRAEAINDYFGSTGSGEQFSSVLYVNVLEHIEDDAAEIVRARETLGPKGHLLVFVPALPWLFSELDKNVGHFRRYLKNDLVRVVEQCGFCVLKARYFDIAGVLPWYVNFVLLKNSIGGGGVALYDKLVVPAMRVVEGLRQPPIGKNILLVARRV